MISDDIIKSIQNDIQRIEPEANKRLYYAKAKARNRHRAKAQEYGRNKKKQESSYQPVVQSPKEHMDDIEDTLAEL